MNKLRKFLVVGVMVLSVIAMSGLPMTSVKAAASAGTHRWGDRLLSAVFAAVESSTTVDAADAAHNLRLLRLLTKALDAVGSPTRAWQLALAFAC